MQSSPTPDAREALAQALQQEIRLAGALLALLHEEQAIVAGFDQQAVLDGVGRKEAVIDALQQAGAARAALVGGEALSAPALARRLEILGDDGSLAALVQELGRLGRACRQENRRVGLLINRRVQFLGRTLGRLKAAPEAGAVYGPLGARQASGGRKLGTV